MASDLPTFSLWTTCAKCAAWDEHDVKFETAGYWGEWLLRTCTRCGYVWEEACVDA